MSRRICPAPACGELLEPDVFACRADWLRLPKPYRESIQRAWRARVKALDTGGERYAAASAAHEAAKAAGKRWYVQNP